MKEGKSDVPFLFAFRKLLCTVFFPFLRPELFSLFLSLSLSLFTIPPPLLTLSKFSYIFLCLLWRILSISFFSFFFLLYIPTFVSLVLFLCLIYFIYCLSAYRTSFNSWLLVLRTLSLISLVYVPFFSVESDQKSSVSDPPSRSW